MSRSGYFKQSIIFTTAHSGAILCVWRKREREKERKREREKERKREMKESFLLLLLPK